MRKLKLYIAMSLNGKIAKADGSVEWLNEIPNPDKDDFGYSAFYNSVDTTIQGYATYRQIVDWGIEFPYKATKNYVFTRNKQHQNTEHVTFVAENHAGFVRELKAEKGKDIWLIGGGQVNTLLLNEGLIDEILVFVMPVVLSDGISLFERLPAETKLKLAGSKEYANGVVELRYVLDSNG